MGDKNHIRTLGDYSKPSHEGYMSTIEHPEGNNVVPLRSNTIREEENVKPNAAEYHDHEMTAKAKEKVKEESKDEFEEKIKEEEEEEEEDVEYFDTFPSLDELRYHEWLLKNPRPP
nr:zinc finger, CCHC-type [Tanacetum cinerariifolium]